MAFRTTPQARATQAAARTVQEFRNAQMLSVYWETTPEAVARLLPSPLKPVARPVVSAFVAYYPETNFNVTYHESALFLRASFEGEEGGYCLSMPVTNDMAMAGGRETFGLPKKMADVQLTRQGDELQGWTVRRGLRFMHLRVKLTGKMNEPSAAQSNPFPVREDGALSVVGFSFKCFPSPDAEGFDYKPRLVRQETVMRLKELQFGEAELLLFHSDYDPWDEVPVVKMLGATYAVADSAMLPGKVVAEVEPSIFMPYADTRWDWV